MKCSTVHTQARRTRLITTAVVASVLLTSCSAQDGPLKSTDGQFIAVSDVSSDAWNQAAFTGQVVWGDAGCMVAGAGSDPYLIVFPKGTRLSNTDEVVLPDGFRIAAGDHVGLGGGFLAADPDSSILAALPAECLTDEIFYASGEVAE